MVQTGETFVSDSKYGSLHLKYMSRFSIDLGLFEVLSTVADSESLSSTRLRFTPRLVSERLITSALALCLAKCWKVIFKHLEILVRISATTLSQLRGAVPLAGT